jgi:hypothetical protein
METYHHLGPSSQNTNIDFDNELVAPSGQRITPSANAEGYHYAENRESVVSGGKVYQGNLAGVAGAAANLMVTNNSYASVDVRFGFQTVVGSTRTGSVSYGAWTAVTTGATIPVPNGTYGNDPNGTGFSATFQWRFTNPTTSHSGSLDLSVIGAVVVGASYAWAPMSFLPDSEEGVDAMTNYLRAMYVSTTGFSCLMQNNANVMNRGGTITACQLAGGSRREIPSDPAEIFRFAANKNGRKVLPSSKLSEGLFWSYHPEKIQDLMFRPHKTVENEFLYGDKELPFILIAMKWTSPESAPTLSFVLNLNMEYITNSIIAPKFFSPVDTVRLLEMWIALGSERNNITENPTHLKDIAKWTKEAIDKTLRNPQFWSAAASIGKAVAPLLLV